MQNPAKGFFDSFEIWSTPNEMILFLELVNTLVQGNVIIRLSSKHTVLSQLDNDLFGSKMHVLHNKMMSPLYQRMDFNVRYVKMCKINLHILWQTFEIEILKVPVYTSFILSSVIRVPIMLMAFTVTMVTYA